MTRLPAFEIDTLSRAQRQVYDKIMSGPRGKFGGPFPALLECPQIADQVQALGGALRFQGRLSPILREVAILVVARHWRCVVEWNAHVVIAEQAGVDRAVIKSILNGNPSTQASPEIRAVIAVCRELNDTKFVSDATYRQAIDSIGLEGVVELTVIAGYFALLSMVLNTFDVAPNSVDGEITDDLRLP